MTEPLTSRDVQSHIREIVYPIFRELGFQKLTPTKLERREGEDPRCPDRYWAVFLKRFSSYDQVVMDLPPFSMQVQFLMMYPCLDDDLVLEHQINKKGEYAPKPAVNLARHFVHLQHPCPTDPTAGHKGGHVWSMDEQTEPFSRRLITDMAERMVEQILPVVRETEDVDTELQQIWERVPASYEAALAFAEEFNSTGFHSIAHERAGRPRPWQRTQEPSGVQLARQRSEAAGGRKDKSMAAYVVRHAVSELAFAAALARHFGRDATADAFAAQAEAMRRESGLWG